MGVSGMGGAFSRARMMFAAIAAAMSIQDRGQRAAAMGNIGPYRSRGKGEGLNGNKRSRNRVAFDKRAALKRRNKQ